MNVMKTICFNCNKPIKDGQKTGGAEDLVWHEECKPHRRRGLEEKAKKLLWFLTDRCTTCGGKLVVWDYKKAWCSVCKAAN